MSDFAGNSAKLAIESIRNSYLRQHYTDLARTTAENILIESNNAELLSPCQKTDVWSGAARKASKLRNVWMGETRSKLSATAHAFSKLLKSEPPTFSEIFKKYSNIPHENYEEPESISCITDARKIQVYQAIVQASGRTNAKINIVSKVTGMFGAISLIVTLGFIFYGIGTSETPTMYVVNLLITFKVGLVGAYLGSRLGSSVGCHFRLKHLYTLILSIFGGICVGVATVYLCGFVVTGINLNIDPALNSTITIL